MQDLPQKQMIQPAPAGQQDPHQATMEALSAIPLPRLGKDKKKIQVLAYCDSPTVSTGFGIVARNVLRQIYNTGKYEITVFGINHWGTPYDRDKFPYDIYPAPINPQGDMMGKERFIEIMNNVDFDILWSIQDTFQMYHIAEAVKDLKRKGRKFKWIYYFPLDADQPQNEWLYPIASADYPVAYNEWAKDKWLRAAEAIQIQKAELTEDEKELISDLYNLPLKIRTIYHGVDEKVFYPLEESKTKKFKKELFKDKEIAEKAFILLNINRNQQRKDFARSLRVLKEFKTKNPDSDALLYLHCNVRDIGGNLDKIGVMMGLKPGSDFAFPDPQMFNISSGVPLKTLNKIYNMADIVISTTMGEGCGLSSYEALACKKPICMPNNTALTETMAEGRGMPVECGKGNSEWIVQPFDNDVVRPLTNVNDMVEKLTILYKNKKKREEIAEKGHKWILNKTWDKIGKDWISLFEEAVDTMTKEKFSEKMSRQGITKIGRNDPCPCGSGKKFKKCHGK